MEAKYDFPGSDAQIPVVFSGKITHERRRAERRQSDTGGATSKAPNRVSLPCRRTNLTIVTIVTIDSGERDSWKGWEIYIKSSLPLAEAAHEAVLRGTSAPGSRNCASRLRSPSAQARSARPLGAPSVGTSLR